MKQIKFSKICIISADAYLAEEVAAHFRKPEEFLLFFDMRNGTIPHEDSLMYGEFSNECTKITNIIQHINPERVVLLGCPTEFIKEVEKRISKNKILILEEYDLALISSLKGFNSSKYDLDPHIITSESLGNKNIIAIEESPENAMAAVVAKNLAIAENAKIIFLPKARRVDAEEIKELFRKWMNSDDDLVRFSSKEEIFSKIQERLKSCDLTSAKTVSFITRGIPYGILPFRFPTTHYFSHKLLCVQILMGVLKSSLPSLQTTSIYLCDPNEFDHSETEEVAKMFVRNKYVVKKAFGENATAHDVHYSSEHFPFDFIFFSTHCGGCKGEEITERFYSSDGKEHIVCYESVVTFKPELSSELVQVTELHHWISLDGVAWTDDKGKKEINAGNLIEEYFKYKKDRTAEEKKKDLLKVTDTGIVKHSDALQMNDFPFMPMFHQIGGYMHPVVFNNACSTWGELSVRFAIAGTSIYIGTTVDIPNPVAVEVATKFSKFILKGMTAGHSLYNAQREHIISNGYTPYLMHGYIFTKPKQTIPRNHIVDKFIKNLSREIDQWEKYIENTSQEELRSNATHIVSFLKNQLQNFLLSRKIAKKKR